MKVLDFYKPDYSNILMQKYLSAEGVDRVYVIIKTPDRHNQSPHFLPNAASKQGLSISSHPNAAENCQIESSLEVSSASLSGQAPHIVLWDLTLLVEFASTYFWSALVWVCVQNRMSKPIGAVEVRSPLPPVSTGGTTNSPPGFNDGLVWGSGATHSTQPP